jgi:PAS domain-containing protein
MRNSRQNIADHLRVAVPETGDAVNVHSISRQRHFESLVNSSDDAIVSKTLDGVVTSWNPAAERIFGYTAADDRPENYPYFPRGPAARREDAARQGPQGRENRPLRNPPTAQGWS